MLRQGHTVPEIAARYGTQNRPFETASAVRHADGGIGCRFQVADQPRDNVAVTLFEHAESIEIACLPETVYDLVTDIRRTGEWSPICQSCWWLDEDGLREGAWFGGLNRADGREWETVSQVAVARRGREFAWLIGGQYARWAYEFEPVVAGTRLTERWTFLPAGAAMFREKYGPDADEMIELRRSQALAGIPATLAAIKRIAEAG